MELPSTLSGIPGPVLASNLVRHFSPYIITSTTLMMLIILMAAKIVHIMAVPTACKPAIEKTVVTEATMDRTQLLIATALADLPGFDSTRYTDVGVNALI